MRPLQLGTETGNWPLATGNLFLAMHHGQAFGVEFQQMPGVFFRLDRWSALKAPATSRSTAVAGGYGDKLHQIQSDIFIASRAQGNTPCVFHAIFSGGI